MTTRLELLRATVKAKLIYWDALRELEMDLAPGGEFTDRANDEVIELVDMLAAGIDGTDVTCVIDEHVGQAEKIVARHR